MSKELIDKIKKNKKVYEMCKNSFFAREEYRGVVRACRYMTK